MNKLLVSSVLVMGLAMDLMAAAPLMVRSQTNRQSVARSQVRPTTVKSQSTPVAAKLRPAAVVASPQPVPVVVKSQPKQEPVARQPMPKSEGSAGGVGLTVKAGTLGGGLEATIGANDYLGFRFGVNMMSAGSSFDWEDNTIKAEMDWLSYGALADLHVFGGGFRVTGGALINKNKFKLKSDQSESVVLNGQEYSASDFRGQVTFSELAPYVGIGYGNAVGADGRWHFACDFGVMFQGEPKVAASATSSDPGLQPVLDEAISIEVAKIQDDANAFKYYPVISVGISYRF